jgi:hypothetical protein
MEEIPVADAPEQIRHTFGDSIEAVDKFDTGRIRVSVDATRSNHTYVKGFELKRTFISAHGVVRLSYERQE